MRPCSQVWTQYFLLSPLRHDGSISGKKKSSDAGCGCVPYQHFIHISNTSKETQLLFVRNLGQLYSNYSKVLPFYSSMVLIELAHPAVSLSNRL